MWLEENITPNAFRVGAILIVVLVLEHIILKYVYGKKSALERLISFQASAKTDVFAILVSAAPLKIIRTWIVWLTLPGLGLLALQLSKEWFHFGGLFGDATFGHWSFKLIAWYLVFDFAYYVAHLMLHKIPFLWRFHKLHHAATEMNIITGTRISLAERAFNGLVVVVFLTLFFGVPRPDILLVLLIIRQIVELVQHSDLPWDYGKLGNFLAGPRFHRMHHSSDRCDYDSNYGNLFTFWDRLFGTLSTRYVAKGSKTADEVVLGLGKKAEDEHFNRWYMPLINETFLDYIYRAWKKARYRDSD